MGGTNAPCRPHEPHSTRALRSEEHLTGGLPVGVIAEVERIATEPAACVRCDIARNG
ncbi:hypothetical protein [Streptomyces antibioticus]|uniref:hypothetical protein n=1 Tax=Streptomyces antibioticus TaxID=1890 RepID=UPI0033EC0F0A